MTFHGVDMDFFWNYTLSKLRFSQIREFRVHVVFYLLQSLIDDFDYGDDDDDASRIAEQRRHLMEEERRLSQE